MQSEILFTYGVYLDISLTHYLFPQVFPIVEFWEFDLSLLLFLLV